MRCILLLAALLLASPASGFRVRAFAPLPMQRPLAAAAASPATMLLGRPTAASKAEEREISDGETALRWIGIQGTVDFTILLGFAYDLKLKIGEDLPFEEFVIRASQLPQLKFIIIMPAITIFFQILRRFGPETGIVVRDQTFEEDPIVKYLGGAAKVRSIRARWTELVSW